MAQNSGEKISADAYEDLMWKNAVKIFGIKGFDR